MPLRCASRHAKVSVPPSHCQGRLVSSSLSDSEIRLQNPLFFKQNMGLLSSLHCVEPHACCIPEACLASCWRFGKEEVADLSVPDVAGAQLPGAADVFEDGLRFEAGSAFVEGSREELHDPLAIRLRGTTALV